MNTGVGWSEESQDAGRSDQVEKGRGGLPDVLLSIYPICGLRTPFRDVCCCCCCQQGEQNGGALSAMVEAAGYVDGNKVKKMQRELTQQRDQEAFERLDARTDAVVEHEQIQILLTTRQLATAGATHNHEYLEVAYEMYYGTPCKAAEPYVGMIVKHRSRSGAVDDRLDAHGHALPRTASSSLTKPRHDSIKWCIDASMNEAGMPHDCEVFNLFAAFVGTRSAGFKV